MSSSNFEIANGNIYFIKEGKYLKIFIKDREYKSGERYVGVSIFQDELSSLRKWLDNIDKEESPKNEFTSNG